MSVMSVFRDYSWQELEQKAEDILSHHFYLLKDRPCEIDIDRIINHMGIILLCKRGIHKKYETPSLAVINGKVIVVDTNILDNVRYEKMLRFTLAEELAHTELHCPIAQEYCKNKEDKLLREFLIDLGNEEEARANRHARKMAEAILMPQSIFIPKFIEVCKEMDINNGDHANDVLYHLTHDFNLNITAVSYRAVNLGLINRSGEIFI